LAVVTQRARTQELVVLAGAVITAVLVIGLSVYHSWLSDFQPQGRYLFAIFGLVAIVVARNRELLHSTVVSLFLVWSFLMAVNSFVNEGLGSIPHFRDVMDISHDFRKPD
jgi:peptidoglycan/LPS O-acetylase OafA/YrhL